MPTRCNRWYLLQILLHVQHVSGNTMPIIRSSRVLYRWLLPVVFGALVFKLSVWCGAEDCVSSFRAAAAPHHTDNLKTKAPNTTGSNHLCNTLELLMMGIVVPKRVEQAIRSAIKNRLLHLAGILFPHKNILLIIIFFHVALFWKNRVIWRGRPILGLYICTNTGGIQLRFLKINCKSLSLK